MKKFLRLFLVCSLIFTVRDAGVSLSGQQETSCPPPQPGFFCAFRGHNDSVLSVAFSPDGKWLASGSSDRTVKLWEITTNTLIRTLPEHAGSVSSVAFSPDGKLLASTFRNDLVKLWETSTGQEMRSLLVYSHVGSLAFSADGRLLAAGGCGRIDFGRLPPEACVQGEIRIWNPNTGVLIRTISAHRKLVRSVAFGPSSKLLASASEDGTVKLWEVATGREVRTLQHSDRVSSVAFSPDGKLLASGDSIFGIAKGTVKLWEVATGREVRTLTLPDGVYDVIFSPDGRFLAVGSRNINIWDMTTGREVRTFSLGNLTVHSITFSPDGRFLASAHGVYPDVRIWYVGDLAGR